jgi:hypothetical protein
MKRERERNGSKQRDAHNAYYTSLKRLPFFLIKMVDLLLICALCDQEMFIACPFCTRPFCGDHAHSICVEHDMDVADRHIAHRYANPEVRLVPVVMEMKYEIMLLCFQNLTPFFF